MADFEPFSAPWPRIPMVAEFSENSAIAIFNYFLAIFHNFPIEFRHFFSKMSLEVVQRNLLNILEAISEALVTSHVSKRSVTRIFTWISDFQVPIGRCKQNETG